MSTEPVPLLAGANPVRAEDGPQDVPQEPGSIVGPTRLIAASEPPGIAAILTAARSQLGTLARSSGWTKYGQWYADNIAHDQEYADANFCDMFVSWCANKTGLASVVGQYAYCPAHAGWFYRQGHWGHTPRPGAVVFFNWYGRTGPDNAEHVGFVESVRSDGRLVTIEANTTEGGAGGPAGVWRRVRATDVVVGYGYPPYPNNPVPVAADDDCWVA